VPTVVIYTNPVNPGHTHLTRREVSLYSIEAWRLQRVVIANPL